jgi:GAF domain-containing protein
MPDRTNSCSLLEGLYRATAALGTAVDATQVGQVLIDFAAGHDVDIARLLLFTEHQDGVPIRLEMREGWTSDGRQFYPYGTELALEAFPLGELLQPDEPAICEDVETDERLGEPLRQVLLSGGTGSLIVLPLTVEDHWLGAVLVGRRKPSTFDPELVWACWILASQAAAALENRQLLADAVERRDRHRLLLDSIRSPVLSLTEDMAILYCNEAYARFVDQPLAELEGQNLLEVFPDFDQRPTYAAYQEVLATGETRLTEGQMGERTVRAHVYRTPWGILAIADDITEQKWSEIERGQLLSDLEEQTRQLQTAAEVSRAAGSILDLEALLRQIVDIVKERSGHYFVSIALVEGDQIAFRHGSTVGDSDRRLSGGAVAIDIQQGQGLIAEAARTGQPVLVEDVLDDPRYLPVEDLPDTRAELAVPIEVKGRVIGTLDVQSDQPSAYDRDDVALLQSLADQVGVVIENARLFEETRKRAEELAGLQQVSLELAQEQQDLETVLETIARRTMSLLSSDGGGVWLWREEDQELELVLDYQVGDTDFSGRRLKPGEGLTGRAFAERKIQTIDDYRSWAGKPSTFQDAPFIAGLAVPMVWQAQAFGALVATRSWEGEPYSSEEQGLAELLAAQAAAVLWNARLFEETQQHLQELTMLSNVSQALAGATLRSDEVAEVVVRQLVDVMGIYEASVSLLDPDGDTMHILADVLRQEGGVRPGVGQESFQLADYPATARVMETLKPLVVHAGDLETDPAELAYLEQARMQTLAIFPLAVKGQAIGILELEEQDQERHFVPEELSLIMTMASQAAVALENAHLFEESQRRAQEMEMINEVGQVVTSMLDLDTLLRQLVDSIKARFGYYFVGVMLTEGHHIIFRDGSTIGDSDVRLPPRSVAMDLRQSSGLVVEAAQTGRPQLAMDVRGDPRYLPISEMPDTRSELDVPIEVRGRVIGVLDVQSTQPNAFDRADVALLQSLTSQAGVAIQNARLFRETESALAETEALYNASRRLGAAGDLQEIVAAVAEGMPIPAINRAVLWFIEYGAGGEAEAFVSQANWYSGEGTPPLPLGTRFSLDQFPAVSLVLSDEPLFSEDIQRAEQVDAATRAAFGQQNAHAIALLPLWIGERQIACLMLVGEDAHHFTEGEMRPYHALARQMAVVVENLRLFEQTERQLADLATIQTTVSQLNAAPTFEDAMDALLPQVSNIVQAEAVSLHLLEGEQLVRAGMYAIVEQEDAQIGDTIHLDDYPLTRWVVESRQALAIKADDPRLQDHARQVFAASGITAAATVPLLGREGVLGTLNLHRRQMGRGFTEREMDLVQTLADQASATLEKNRLLEQVQARAAELAVLNEMSGALTTMLDVESVIENIYRFTSRLMDTTNCYIARYDPEMDMVSFPLAVEHGERVPWRSRQAGQGLTEYVIRSAEPLLIEEDVVGKLEEVGIESIGAMAHSWLGVPLQVGDQVLGVITIQNYTTPRAFGERHRDLLVAIANQAAIALENARLFQQAQTRARQERVLREITTRVRASTDPETIMRTAVRELGATLGRPAFVRLGNVEQLADGHAPETGA